MGEIVSIWIQRAHRGPMDRATEADLVAGRGVRNSADQGGKCDRVILSREDGEGSRS